MRKNLLLIILFFFTCSLIAQDKGHLVIIGGGDRSDIMMNKIIELAGGKQSRFIIIPNASYDPVETGKEQVNQFKEELGCENTDFIHCTRENADADSNLKKLDGVTGIFFSGGDQSRLTRDLLNTEFLKKIKEIYLSGGVLSGTSAGAAVMSEVMITGNELINKDSIYAFISIEEGNIETVEGFGFITSAVIDQHFIKRKRHNRLISITLEHPELIGTALDESTAIIVYPDDTFEVIGENQVLIYDATDAKNIRTDKKGILSATDIKMHILISGDKYDLKNKKFIE